MIPGRIQDPEGAKAIVITFKTTTGAIAAIQRHTLRFVYFVDKESGRLMTDTTATTGGKQNPAL